MSTAPDITTFQFKCAAVGCKILVRYDGKMCFPHWRKVPVAIKRRITARDPGARLDAIRAVASKEGKTRLFYELLMAQDRQPLRR